MQHLRVPFKNAEDEEEEDDSSRNDGIKLDEEDNAFGYFQKNSDNIDKDKDRNAGDDTIFFENLVWEDIGNYLVIPDIPDNYCGTHGLKEGVENLFQTFI